jgi:2-polyprenyl-3-methyl-5-hydroxy-6-metoxy-1,4-benzoquinol methylase
MSDNKNIELLIELNVSTKSSLKVFHGSTRDVDNLNVLKCNKSGVIVLERVEVGESYYEENIHYTNEFKGENHVQNGVILSTPLEDDIRRFESYKDLISNSEILDFGCGRGGLLN